MRKWEEPLLRQEVNRTTTRLRPSRSSGPPPPSLSLSLSLSCPRTGRGRGLLGGLLLAVVGVAVAVGVGMGMGIGSGLWLPQGAVEVSPMLLVKGAIVDTETGLPVEASVYLDGRLLDEGVSAFSVRVPSGSELRVEAKGYHLWAFRFRYKLKGSYGLHGPIRLRRTNGTEAHDEGRE